AENSRASPWAHRQTVVDESEELDVLFQGTKVGEDFTSVAAGADHHERFGRVRHRMRLTSRREWQSRQGLHHAHHVTVILVPDLGELFEPFGIAVENRLWIG